MAKDDLVARPTKKTEYAIRFAATGARKGASHERWQHKLRAGKQLTAVHLQELERILTDSGGFSPAEIAAGATEAHGLGLLIRSIVGRERASAGRPADATMTMAGCNHWSNFGMRGCGADPTNPA